MMNVLINIIQAKICINPSSSASKTYNINMNMFDDGQPEELLSLLKNFKIATDGPRTTTPSGRINYLGTMLHVRALRIFDELQSQYGCLTNNYLKLIQEVLLEYFFPINSLSRQNRAMKRTMRKPQSTTFKRLRKG